MKQKRKELLQTSQASFKTSHILTFKAPLELQLLLGWDMGTIFPTGSRSSTTEPLQSSPQQMAGSKL